MPDEKNGATAFKEPAGPANANQPLALTQELR
jgi:hypothetical protein